MSRRNKRGLLAAQPIFAIICRQLDAGTFPCSSLGFACAFVARRLHLLCYTLSPLSHVLLALRRDYTVVNKGSHQEQFARVVGRTCRVALRPKSSPRCGCRCGCGLPGFWKCRFLGLKSMMSALPPKADMCSALTDVCFGPIADIGAGEDCANALAYLSAGLTKSDRSDERVRRSSNSEFKRG